MLEVGMGKGSPNQQRAATPPLPSVEELRRRYVEGTLDEILIPEDVDLDQLLRDLFPDLAAQRQTH